MTAADQLPTTSNRRVSRWLRTRLTECKRPLRYVVAAGIGEGVAITAQAALLAALVHQQVIEQASLSAALPLAAGFALAASIRAVLRYGGRLFAFDAAAQVKTALRRDTLDALRRLGPAYCGRQESGALSSLVIDQVEAVEGYVSRFTPQMGLSVAIPLIMLIAVFSLNWIAGLIFLLTAPLIPVFMALAGMGAAHMHRKQFDQLARLGAHFLDRVRGLTTLKLFDLAEREAALVGEIAQRYRRRTMAVLRIAFLSSAVLEFFSAVAIALGAVYVGLSLLGKIGIGTYGGDLTLFTGVFILVLAPEFFMPLRTLAAHYHDRASGVGAASALLPVLEAAEAQKPAQTAGRRDKAVTAARPARAPAIVFEDITVRYAPDRPPALDRFSLAVDRGEAVVLSGASGSGKSTALALLLGFVQPESGTITIDGSPLETIDPAIRLGLFGYVPQRTHVLYGTIAENIALAQPNADRAALQRAADAAHVTPFVHALPDGLQTALGEGGYGLSGGQAQRIALARAFLADPAALLLDEPTSALDAETEALVLDSIDRLRAGRTVIAATHSPALQARADRVIALEPPQR